MRGDAGAAEQSTVVQLIFTKKKVQNNSSWWIGGGLCFKIAAECIHYSSGLPPRPSPKALFEIFTCLRFLIYFGASKSKPVDGLLYCRVVNSLSVLFCTHTWLSSIVWDCNIPCPMIDWRRVQGVPRPIFHLVCAAMLNRKSNLENGWMDIIFLHVVGFEKTKIILDRRNVAPSKLLTECQHGRDKGRKMAAVFQDAL